MRKDGHMRTRKVLVAAATGVLVAVGAGGVAVASSHDDDSSVTGRPAERATAAALQATHGGRANPVERDGENGATWEAEVTEAGGDTADLRPDEQYRGAVI